MVTAEAAWSTAELLARAAGAACWLDSLDLPVGEPVPAVLWPSAGALALVIGGAMSRRPIATLGPQLTEHELAACVDGLAASTVVGDELSAAVVARVAARRGARAVALPAFDPRSASPLAVHADDIAAVLHTSGTSGAPRRIALRQGPLGARASVIADLLSLGPGSRYVTAKGIHHIGGLGLSLAALAAGAAVIPFPRFTTDGWLGLASLAPTHGSVVPSMIEMLLAAGAGGVRPPSMRVLQYGGAPIDPATLVRLVEDEPDLDLVGLYGQTEGSPVAAMRPDDHRLAVRSRRLDLLGSAGRPAPGVEVAIDSAGPDGVGEVWARAAHFFEVGDDGWLRTGDLGRVDDEGWLRLSGRAGDTIIRGGENVHPLEVERVLAEHPGVADVAVAGVHDRRLGQTVGAWIVAADPARPPATEELRAHVRDRLAGFKVPAIWTFCDTLPRNANGKVVRRLLEAR